MSAMTIGELLHVAQELFRAKAPIAAPVLLVDDACMEGAEPLLIMDPEDVPSHVVRDVHEGAAVFRVKRRVSSLVDAGGRALQ